MEFFVRYFVEIELPSAAVETALDEVPAGWLLAMANTAHARALGFLLEADPLLGGDLAGSVVELGMAPAVRHRSTTIRTMAWALIGPNSARPLLEADLEVGALGHGRSQLSLAGRYYFAGRRPNQPIDRGTAQRFGETAIKDFVDGLAKMIEKLALGVPGLRLPLASPGGTRLDVV